MNSSIATDSKHLRAHLCGLPHILSFPPMKNTEEENDNYDRDSIVWNCQLQETKMMADAYSKIQWLIRRIPLIEEIDGSNISSSASSLPESKEPKHGIRQIISDLFGRQVALAIFSESNSEHIPKWAHWITQFDLLQLSRKLEENMGYESLSILVENIANSPGGDEKYAEIRGYWSSLLSVIPKCDTWYDLLLLPLEDAAKQILNSFSELDGNELKSNDDADSSEVSEVRQQSALPPNEVSSESSPCTSSKSSPEIKPEQIQNYLVYHSSFVYRKLQHFVLPSLQKQLHNKKQKLQRLKEISNDWEKKYDQAFENWDEYCMNVLGVESDSLPLFPLEKVARCNVGGDEPMGDTISAGDDAEVLEYANEVAKCVLKPMREEFERLSDKFLRSIVMVDAVSPDDAEKENNGKHSRSNGIKCYGKEISEAISYYRQFSEFVASPQWEVGSNDNLKLTSDDDSTDDSRGDSDVCAVLHLFVSSSTKVGDASNQATVEVGVGASVTNSSSASTYKTLLNQFMDSPITRVDIVSDLQQLDAFLSSRKREMLSFASSSGMQSSNAPTLGGAGGNASIARGGRAVVEAMDMEWTQYCMAGRNNDKAFSSAHTTLCMEGIALEDVTRYHSATQSVLGQITGDSAQAKRLHLLADAVGFPVNEPFSAIRDMSYRFQMLCLQAAQLAKYMNLCNDQREAITQTIQMCVGEVSSVEREARTMEIRMKWILECLKERLK